MMLFVEENVPMGSDTARRLLKQVVTQTEKEAKRKQDIVIQLRKIADELDIKQRDMNIAKTAFASGGIVGTGLTIAGIVAAPFTFGASLGLTVGGIAVGVSSGLGGLATTIADWIINSNTMKDAQAMVDDYQETVNILVDLLQQVKRSNCIDFQSLMSEELSNMDANQRLTLESILTGMKTGAEVVGSAGRSTAVVGAVAARATMAAGKTMMETLETGIKAVKIGGVVLSVLTVPLDLHAMITNSIKIHNNTPSETAEEIRKLATHLEKYRMVSTSQRDDEGTQTTKDEMKTLKQEVEKAIPDLRKIEQVDKNNRRSKRKLREHLTRLVEKVPKELNQLAVKYDQSNNTTNVTKFLCLALQVFGTALIVFGMLSDLLGLWFEHMSRYGVMVVIGSGIVHLMLEMYTELANSSLWRDAETELERYLHTIQVLTDLNGPEVDHCSAQVENIFGVFRCNLHSGYYMRRSHRAFTLIAVKLLLDVCALLFAASFEDDAKLAISSESDMHTELLPLETALAFVSYPIGFFTDMQIWTAGAFVYIFTLPVTVYLLLLRLGEIRRKNISNVTEAMNNLAEDFCIRFNHITLDANH